MFSRLFKRSAPSDTPKIPPEIYKDFVIRPDPIKDGKIFRIAAMIEKEIDGDMKSHHLIRADTLGSHDAAIEASVAKAKLMIDQLGSRIFDQRI